MSSPRAEFTTARLVSAATIILAVGLLLVSSLVLFDDFRERRDQRALIAASSDDALQDDLAELEGDIARSLSVADEAGADLAQRLDEAEGASTVALSAAVIESAVGRTLPALDRVIFQDAVAQATGVDRFGSQTPSPEAAGFDLNVANGRSVAEPFTADTGRVFVSDGFGAYYPVGQNAIKGWVVLILRGDELAVDSTFDRLARGGAVESSISYDGADANMTVAVPFAGSDFVATRQVPIPNGAPPSWLPFIIRVAGAAIALAGVFILGHFVRKNYQVASRRLQNAEATPYGSSTDFEQNIIGVVELDGVAAGRLDNQAYCDQVRRERDDLIGTSLLALTEPADRTRHLAALDKLMTGAARTTQVEHRILNGEEESEVWVLEHLSRSENSEGNRILVQSQDITFRRYATWELAKQALHDELTGLANRAMLVH